MKKNQDSLTIIEDCLDKIYQSRRANLLSKHRKFKEKQARKAFDQPEPIKYYAKTESTNNNYLSDYADKDVLEELAVKYKAPPVAAVPYVKEKSHIAKQYEDQDAEAKVLFKTFCDDLQELIEDSPMRLPEDEFRADHCERFIMKYLTDTFDKMMATRTLSKIKKHFTYIIEEFSSVYDPPHVLRLIEAALVDLEGLNGKPALVKKHDSDEGVGAGSGATQPPSSQATSSTTTSSKPTGSNSSTALNTVDASKKPPLQQAGANAAAAAEPSAVDSAVKGDKQRIKKQYEQLMSLKKKAENHPDDSTIQQYSALHADIQSVIDSIQKKAPVW